MSAIVNRYNGTVQMADSTVQAIMALNKLWIPDVLIDIIKDYLYIDAYSVWRKFSQTSVNRSIASIEFEWSNIYDIQGRVRLIHWTKGNAITDETPWPIQMQCCVCVSCGESDSYHNNWDGCCAMEGDTLVDGHLHLTESDSDYEYDDDASYQDDTNDW